MGFLRRLFGDEQQEEGKPIENQSQQEDVVEPRQLTGEEFDQVISSAEVPVVVDFWAEWCGPCHAIAPAVAQLAAAYDGRAIVAKLNADEYPDILSRYGILGIPTLIYFQNGEEADRIVGMTAFPALQSKLENLLA